MRRIVAIAVAVVVLCSALVAPVAAASTTVELDRALDDQRSSETLSFTFTADQNTTVSSPEIVERDGGNVEFAFESWSRVGSGVSDDDSEWDVTDGEQYRVTYEASALSGATETTHSATVTVENADGSAAAREELSTTVDYLDPEFGRITPPEESLIFEDPGPSATTVTADVPNVGDGVMVVETARFSNVPDGITVDVKDKPDRIDAGRTGQLDLTVEAAESLPEGSYQFTVEVQDNLGRTTTFDATVEVRKPPVAGVEGDTVDLGDVLVDNTNTTSFEIQEQAGFKRLDGVDVVTSRSDRYGSLTFDGLSYVTVQPGGSETAEASVTIENAPQHEELEWEVQFSGRDRYSPPQTTTFEARVIYPATLGEVDTTFDRLTFDQPQSADGRYQQEVPIAIPNEGDLAMDVESIEASVDSRSIDATVAHVPDSVEGLETGEGTVQLNADRDHPEGTYTLTVRVETAEAGTQVIRRQFDVVHGVEMTVQNSDVDFGEVRVSERRTRSIDVSEHLEYEELENVRVTKISGPDQWLDVTEEPPASLNAGDSAPLIFEVTFDTEAEAYQQYEWTYEVRADNAEDRTITVGAVARLLSAEAIVSDLDEQATDGGWQSTVAGDTATTLEDLEDDLRNGASISDGDLARTVTISQSTVALVDSLEAAERHQANGNFEAAQSETVSAVVTHNRIREYGAEIEDDRTRSRLLEAAAAADEPLSSVVSSQRDHYQSRIDADDAAVLERAQARENVAQLAALKGDEERAERLRSQASADYDEYDELVDEGVSLRQEVRDDRRSFASTATLTVLGQPLVLNPTRIDEVRVHSESVRQDYREAESALRQAGATAEADSVAAERNRAATETTILVYGLYAMSLLIAGLFAALIVRTALNAVTYVRESTIASSGDFLLVE